MAEMYRILPILLYPEDVKEKLLRFAKAGLAVAIMRGKSYLGIGSVSMGIAGSIVNPEFLQEYLGMRAEYVDCSELMRRIQLGIYDKEEYERALLGLKSIACLARDDDYNPESIRTSREKKRCRLGVCREDDYYYALICCR